MHAVPASPSLYGNFPLQFPPPSFPLQGPLRGRHRRTCRRPRQGRRRSHLSTACPGPDLSARHPRTRATRASGGLFHPANKRSLRTPCTSPSVRQWAPSTAPSPNTGRKRRRARAQPSPSYCSAPRTSPLFPPWDLARACQAPTEAGTTQRARHPSRLRCHGGTIAPSHPRMDVDISADRVQSDHLAKRPAIAGGPSSFTSVFKRVIFPWSRARAAPAPCCASCE